METPGDLKWNKEKKTWSCCISLNSLRFLCFKIKKSLLGLEGTNIFRKTFSTCLFALQLNVPPHNAAQIKVFRSSKKKNNRKINSQEFRRSTWSRQGFSLKSTSGELDSIKVGWNTADWFTVVHCLALVYCYSLLLTSFLSWTVDMLRYFH